jgi:Tol biopolymer transport system component
MPCSSPDGLELYFNHGPTEATVDIWVWRRTTPDSPWGPPSNLGPMVNSPGGDAPGSMSADGLSLYLFSDRSGGFGSYDIWVTTRPTVQDDWGVPTNLGPVVNSGFRDQDPIISPDGLELYFTSDRPGGFGGRDLWVTKRATVSDAWGTPTNLGAAVNSPADEWYSAISPDGRLLILTSNRPGGCASGGDLGLYDLYLARRATKYDPWGAPVNLGSLINGPYWDSCPNLSADGSMLYFVRSMDPAGFGFSDLWQVPILPITDFNGDEIVDANDQALLVAHLGTADPNYDIGPMPWGDGKVDANDLEVLKRYLGQEFLNPMPVARWKLDETEGGTAHDSAGVWDGILHDAPVWQSTGGVKGGALQLDGVDDYVSTEKILNPATGPFSVFAWVKGGGPGQVILSQASGANWLMLTPEGALATELKQSGRQGKPLASAAMIADDVWHQIGLVWDGSNRIFYVDDVEVARDKQANLADSAGGLHIGAGATLAPSSFWSGLIDDVRIYKRAGGL